jgi:membrane protein YqaA with SNARE-associated domain
VKLNASPFSRSTSNLRTSPLLLSKCSVTRNRTLVLGSATALRRVSEPFISVNTLKHIFQHYKDWVMAVLLPLGPWGVLTIAFIDAAAFGIPLDPVIAAFVYRDSSHTLLYALMGALGSAAGSTIPYIIGYKGGEAFLVKKIGQKRFDRIHGNTEKYGELGLMIACIMPPGFPFKLFVFSAGVAEMTYIRFLISIFAGRLARLLILSALTIRFGPQIVSLIGVLISQHRVATLVGIAVLALIIFLFSRRRARNNEELTAE